MGVCFCPTPGAIGTGHAVAHPAQTPTTITYIVETDGPFRPLGFWRRRWETATIPGHIPQPNLAHLRRRRVRDHLVVIGLFHTL